MPEATITPGPETSEHGFTKWVSILSTAVTVAGVALAAVGTLLTSLHDIFPAAGWITAALALVTGIAGIVASVAKYTGGRSDVKVADLNNQAAKALAAAPAATVVATNKRP